METAPAALPARAVCMALASVVLGFGAQGFVELALTAGEQLFDPAAYREAVLGVGGGP